MNKSRYVSIWPEQKLHVRDIDGKHICTVSFKDYNGMTALVHIIGQPPIEVSCA